MAGQKQIEFGYSPPVGDRDFETINQQSFVSDLDTALEVASGGFSSVWISDHLMFERKIRIECWTLLTWIAARHPHFQLGTLVLANSFRNPALLAKMAASLQYLSGNRFILGYGAGWYEPEYSAYGYSFPCARERIAMLADGIQVIRAVWTETPANFGGQHYQVRDVHCEPRPDPVPPIMVGGTGDKHVLRVVAEHADWWNVMPGFPPDMVRKKLISLREHCKSVSRDYSAIRKTMFLPVILNSSHLAAKREAEKRNPWKWALVGDDVAIVDQLQELSELGFDLFQLMFPNFPDTDDIQLFMDKVLTRFP